MGTTARAGLHYPELTDAPNGPAQMKQLADDTDSWLFRAFRCTSTTRPTGVPNDFVIRESDTTNLYVWTGSTWQQIAGAAGGGSGSGAVTTVSATYAATSAQSVPISTDTVIAFGVQLVADNAVTRATSGAGHQFTLTQTRLWTISTTIRFAQNAVGGRTFELRAGSTVIAKASAAINADGPYTANLSVTRKMASGTVITAVGRHNSNTSLSLEPSGGDYVHIDLAGV